MSATLLAFAPLACPIGMAAMMGIPALIYRARRRRLSADPNGPREAANGDAFFDFDHSALDDEATAPHPRDAAGRPDALAGAVAGKS
jgi:hypothetical protein